LNTRLVVSICNARVDLYCL